MGLLDRFKKESDDHADAFLREATLRVRTVTGVTDVSITESGDLRVSWGSSGTGDIDVSELRDRWTAAAGFDRIEIMDEFVQQLGPPPPGAATFTEPEPAPLPEPEPAPAPEPVAHVEPDVPDAAEQDPEPATTTPPEPQLPPEPAPEPAPVAPTPAASGSLLDGIQSRLQMVVKRPVDVDHGVVSWTIGGVLAAQVVLDHANSLPLTTDELASWGMTPDQAATAAIRNLIALDPELDPVGDGARAWVVTQPEEHPPVWLCSPDRLLQRLELREAVLLAPLPTELVVVDPTDEDALDEILRSTKAIVTTERGLLWPAPMRVTMDTIEPWVPSNSHRCATVAAEMHSLAQVL